MVMKMERRLKHDKRVPIFYGQSNISVLFRLHDQMQAVFLTSVWNMTGLKSTGALSFLAKILEFLEKILEFLKKSLSFRENIEFLVSIL